LSPVYFIQQSTNVDWKETHSDLSEKNAGRSERGLGWCDVRGLREIQGIDGLVQ